MDCNKEDAIKARDVAEGKMLSEDYLGAKKFILKSQRLFPMLGGLTQMLALVDVHISAGQAGDELSVNWHQILQVEECADEETVRKQYRKLLLLLHPDKNKYPGAESAFKLVQSAHEAFEKGKELAKASVDVGVIRRFWALCTECKAQSEHLESMEYQFVQCPQCLRSFLAVRFAQSKETSQTKSKEAFNSDFQCPTQQESNVDVGMEDELKTKGEPLSSSSSSFEDFERRRIRRRNVGLKRKAKLSPSTSPDGSEKRIRRKSKQGPAKGKVPMEKDTQAGVSSRTRRRVTCLVDSDTDHSCETSPKNCHTDFTSQSKTEDGLNGKDGQAEETSDHHMQEMGDMQGADVHVVENRMKETGCMQGVAAHVVETSHKRMKESECVQGAEVHLGDCSHHHEYENVKDDAKKDVHPKVLFFQKLKSALMNEFKGGEFQVVKVRQDNLSGSALDAEHGIGPNDKVFHLKMDVSFTHAATSACVHPAISEDCMVGGSEIWEEEEESIQCEVPDSDVFNFDIGRQEDHFEAGQIWAIYDDDDGFPRFYAHITEVISVRPFHVSMRWLFPAKTVCEEVKAWIDAGFAYTCGEFTLGRKFSRKEVCMFSHIMAHETREVPHTIRIYPQKGDVWALYKVWKPCKGRTRKCEAVVVLSHYSKELGVQVATLFKVNGYKSIFCRKGTEGFRNIPASELLRFSHQIPAHYLVGNEVSNLPAEECVDLDTAAFK
ncbi:hypothetical protein GOP47_0015997 [Adiantum capillus-veneris]|uniref:J domain-containing protein n=1 Tax=Adiantum capillus-veneris TaxID=13818 RepID=A0A9D4UKT0_ADICA|nr:hypothetical protein GOP47_0015997 [Adiantum capillus-veneris]